MPTAHDENTREKTALAELLRVYSLEVTAHDDNALAAVKKAADPGTEVFIANLPNQPLKVLVQAASQLRHAGLEPVPHIVARNLKDRSQLEETLDALAKDAGVQKALILGGDRDQPAGDYKNALQLIETGCLEKYGIREIAIACYPEGHPRIPQEILEQALQAKLQAAKAAGLETLLVSQFLFDPQPLLSFVSHLRGKGIATPLRVGVAGPANRAKLIRYALRCGVGASLKVLRERGDLARNVLAGETPEALLGAIALAQKDKPELGITGGAHFFTFGDPGRSAQWAKSMQAAA